VIKGLCEWYSKVGNHEKALIWVEELIKLNSSSIDSYDNAVKWLISLAKETLDISYIDTALAHAQQAHALSEDINARDSIKERKFLQITELEKLKHEIVRDKIINNWMKLKLKITKVFENYEYDLEDVDDIDKNKKMNNLFLDLIEKKINKAKQDYEDIVNPICQQTPDYFEWPITYELMKDPITTNDNCTYESQEINMYVDNYGGKSPMNRATIYKEVMYPNIALKKAIEEFSQKSNLTNSFDN
jgi:tetratricopeptide (TPR) repeat protein